MLDLRDLDGPRPETADQPAKPLGGGGALITGLVARLGVCQLLRDLREVDLKVVKQDIVHCVS